VEDMNHLANLVSRRAIPAQIFRMKRINEHAKSKKATTQSANRYSRVR
jgi:hypothetical protein